MSGVYDGNPAKVGQEFFGYEVRPVDEVASAGSDPVTVIASSHEIGALHGVYHFLRLMQTGRSIDRLGITERTATFHVGNVLAKLGADGRVEAIHFARKRGLI